jgi:hypothetical protein
MIPPPSQNTVAVCNQINLLIIYYISSRLVTLLKVIEGPLKFSDILVPTDCFKFITFTFQIFLLFFLKCLLASCLTLFRLSRLLYFKRNIHIFLICAQSFFNPAPDSSDLIPKAFGSFQTWTVHFWGIHCQPKEIYIGDSNFFSGETKEGTQKCFQSTQHKYFEKSV